MTTPVTDRFGNQVPQYYTGYFNTAGNTELLSGLRNNLELISKFISEIPPDKENHAYAPGKWTVKEVFMHIIDVERIFVTRAFRFARNDQTPLPGFDENEYMPFANTQNRTPDSIMKEYRALRLNTIEMFSNFTDEMRARTGLANKVSISVETLGMTLIGHELHHLNVIRERYL